MPELLTGPSSGLRIPNARPPMGAATVLGGALVAFYVMLPLDRGFPRLQVLGHPLSSAVAATLVVFALLAVLSRGRILQHLTGPYCLLQTLYFVILVEASLRSDMPLAALHVSLMYYCTFVLNYVILLEAAGAGQVSRLGRIVAAIAAAAAAIAVLQGLAGVRMPMYERWFESYYQTGTRHLSAVGVRGLGTLNQPLIFAAAMALALPYMLSFRNVLVRVLAYSLLFGAAALTASRTFLLGAAAFCVGAVVLFRWRTLWAVGLLGVALGAGIAFLGGWTRATNDPRVRYLGARLGLVESPEGDLAAGNIRLRQAALARGVREVATTWGPVDWILGEGQLSSSRLGEAVSSEFRTVDNAFFGVFYEKGLIGLALFLWAFLALVRSTYPSARRTLHWYSVFALFGIGVSFNFDAYSTFNILAVGSMAIATVVSAGGERNSRARPHASGLATPPAREPLTFPPT